MFAAPLSPGKAGAPGRSPAGPRSCGPPESPRRLVVSGAMAGVQTSSAQATPASPPSSSSPGYSYTSPSTSGKSPTSPAASMATPSRAPPRPNPPLQILAKAASAATRTSQRVDLDALQKRLAACKSFPSLQMLAMQNQNALDQQGVVMMLRRAAQLAAGVSSAAQQDQYACARFLESVAMSCASIVPTMAPATVAGILGTLGALVASGLVQRKQVPYMVVVLVQALILASMPQLHHYTGPQLAHVIRGTAQLSPSAVPEVWLDEWEAAIYAKVPELGPDSLAAVLGSLDVLFAQQGWQPSGAFLSAFLQCAEPKLTDFRGRDLRETLLAVSELGLEPTPGWVESFKEAFDMRAPAMEAQDIASVLFAFTKMQVKFA